jgi:hypothetical protein
MDTATTAEIAPLPKVSHFENPESFNLSQPELEIMLFVLLNPGLRFEHWPLELRRSRSVEKLRRDRHILRRYMPTRFYVSRGSYELASAIARVNGVKRTN